MAFNFSIRKALTKSWQIYARHPLFLSAMAFVMVIFNIFSQTHSHDTLLMIVVIIAALLWSYVWISVALAAADGKEDILDFNSLSVHMPNVREFFTLVGVTLLTAVIVAAAFFIPLFAGILLISLISFGTLTVAVKILIVIGFIALLIPGVYMLVRLIFTPTAYVDRQGSVGKTLKYSWHLVKGKIFWTVFLTVVIELALVLLGSLLLYIGLLVTYPLAILLVTQLYRAVSKFDKEPHQEYS